MTTTGQWIDAETVIAYLGSDAPGDSDAEERLDNAITSASELLYSLSGRKFPGIVQTVVKPTSRMEQQTRPSLVSITWRPTTPQWWWSQGFVFIGLGRSPIVSIEEVTIDDEVIDPINYHVDDARWLVLDGKCCSTWPNYGCGDMFVRFTFGEDPPQLGKDAALILSAEMYRAMTPGASCKLPARLTSITRQGISMALIDPMDFMEKGLTGIYQIDMFIKSFNPGGQIRKPLVFSPDMANVGKRPTFPVAPAPPLLRGKDKHD